MVRRLASLKARGGQRTARIVLSLLRGEQANWYHTVYLPQFDEVDLCTYNRRMYILRGMMILFLSYGHI